MEMLDVNRNFLYFTLDSLIGHLKCPNRVYYVLNWCFSLIRFFQNISEHGVNVLLVLKDVGLEFIDGLFQVVTVGIVHVKSKVLSVFLELLSQGHHFLRKSIDCAFIPIIHHLELWFGG